MAEAAQDCASWWLAAQTHLEELFHQVPVALLALDAGHIFKRVHLNVIWEVL